MIGFTHVDSEGQPTMVDVSEKGVTSRSAMAQALVVFPMEVFEAMVKTGWATKKGSVTQTALIAGTMAAKNTSQLIPMCHQIGLESVKIHFEMLENCTLRIESIVKCSGKTGVEMEALTAASVAALTVYDMCKAFSHQIEIQDIRLLHKSGGKNEF